MLSQPTTVQLVSGKDPQQLALNKSRDYVLVMPAGGIQGTVNIYGGHNVVLIGGSITVPSTANQTDNGKDGTDTGLYIVGSTGTVHIEGLTITGQPNTQFDGIDIDAPAATVQLENIRMTNLWGGKSTEHADVIQTWGGVADLRIDNLTADGDYQGLTINPNLGPVGSVELENVNLTLDPRPAALASTTAGGGYMMWLTNATNTCDAPQSISLSNVYIDDQSPQVAARRTVWPGAVADNGLACAGIQQGNQMSWPNLPITGVVTLSAPPQGPFVPAGSAGTSYASPGYAPPA